jgi:hypothetical protein
MKYLKIITAICLIGSGILSCQKEIEGVARPGSTPDSSSSGLLKKTVSTNLPENIDWLTIEYEYDSIQRISTIFITQKIKQTNGSIITKNGTVHFFRDPNGRIIRIGTMPDTASFNIIFNYENAVSQYPLNAVSLRHQPSGADKVLASTVFEYDNNNRVVKTTPWIPTTSNTMVTNSYELNFHDTNGNITEKKAYRDDNGDGIFELNIAYSWEYDNHHNPKYQNETAFSYWQGIWPYIGSPNNVVLQFNHYPSHPDDQVEYTFLYDNSGIVMSVKKAGDPDNETKYYYY